MAILKWREVMSTISVIIPTYGEPKYLKDAIESVINQTFKDWSLIVVDDNNPDTLFRQKTEKIMEQFNNNEKVNYIKHNKNKNGAAARNTGLKYVNSKYVAFLDSDDIYLPTRLQECYDALEKNNCANVAGVYTGCEFRRNGKKYSEYIDVKSGNHIISVLACSFMFCTGSNIFMKSSVVNELNGFDESFIRHQDYEFLVRYFEKYDLIGLKKILVIKNNDNINAPNVEREIAVKKHYLEKYEPILNKLKLNEKNYIYHNQCIQIAESAISEKNYELSRKYYNKAKMYCNDTLKQAVRRYLLLARSILMK